MDQVSRRFNKPFRYDIAWSLHPDYSTGMLLEMLGPRMFKDHMLFSSPRSLIFWQLSLGGGKNGFMVILHSNFFLFLKGCQK